MVAVDTEPVQLPSRGRTIPMPVWIAAIAVGVLLIVVGTVPFPDLNAAVKVVLVIAGLASLYVGSSGVAKAVFGPQFDLGLWLSIAWIVILVLLAVFADFLPLRESVDVANTFDETPYLRPDLFSAHPLGTDRQALDVLGQIIYGARVSLQVSIGAVVVGMIVGGTIGMLSGFYRGSLDALTAVVNDSILAFPPLILLLALVTALDRSVTNIVIGLSILVIPTYARLARANTLVYAEREFVLASRAMGAKSRRIVAREILPNVILPLLSYAFIIMALLIVAEGSLSFLGLSIQRPNPTWGNIIAVHQDDLERNPHVLFAPGIAMIVTIYCLNRIGEKARQMWDPRESTI